jgi:hypothetical protein
MNKVSIVLEWVPREPLSMCEVYALPHDTPASPVREPGRRSRLMLVHRGHNHRITNEEEVMRYCGRRRWRGSRQWRWISGA